MKQEIKAGIIFGLLIIYTVSFTQVNRDLIELENPEYDPNIENCEINEIAKEIADAREYVKGIYDCSDYTDDLVYTLRNHGYKAQYIHGYYLKDKYCMNDNDCENFNVCMFHKCYGHHAWTRVILNIESTSGNLISNEKLRNKYIEK